MLRWVIALLVLANAGYFMWTQGHLAAWGWAPPDPSEPERLNNQIAPQALRLLNAPRTPEADAPPAANPPAQAEPAPPAGAEPPPGPATPTAPPPAEAAPGTPVAASETAATSATTAVVPAPPPTACWQAGAFTEAQAEPLRNALAQLGLPSGSWQLTESRIGGRWIVYMGRFDSPEALERKKAELRTIQMPFRVVSTPGLGPGLALGTYSTEGAAQQALQDAVRAGVRTARVAQERAESRSFTLRLPAIVPAQRSAVAGLGPALAGKTLEACR